MLISVVIQQGSAGGAQGDAVINVAQKKMLWRKKNNSTLGLEIKPLR